MYYIYGVSVPSLLIESTDSMIMYICSLLCFDCVKLMSKDHCSGSFVARLSPSCLLFGWNFMLKHQFYSSLEHKTLSVLHGINLESRAGDKANVMLTQQCCSRFNSS